MRRIDPQLAGDQPVEDVGQAASTCGAVSRQVAQSAKAKLSDQKSRMTYQSMLRIFDR